MLATPLGVVNDPASSLFGYFISVPEHSLFVPVHRRVVARWAHLQMGESINLFLFFLKLILIQWDQTPVFLFKSYFI